MRFHSTRVTVISLTPIREVWPSQYRFSQNKKIFNRITLLLRISHTEFYPHRTINVEDTDTNLRTPVSKVRASLRPFSRNS
jgi:hypothetical protein